MTILALDLGTKLGWAISFGPNETPLHGTVEFRTGRFEGGGMRWLLFRRWLQNMHDGQGPLNAVYFEEVQGLRGQDAARVFGGYLAILTAWCEQREIPYKGVPVGTIKKHATGKGNSAKPAMIAAMRAKGFTPETDNDADALALLLCVLDEKEVA